MMTKSFPIPENIIKTYFDVGKQWETEKCPKRQAVILAFHEVSMGKRHLP